LDATAQRAALQDHSCNGNNAHNPWDGRNTNLSKKRIERARIERKQIQHDAKSFEAVFDVDSSSPNVGEPS
jgi:hypothetical protein